MSLRTRLPQLIYKKKYQIVLLAKSLCPGHPGTMRMCPCRLGGRADNAVPFTLTLDHATAPEAPYRADARCDARHAGQLKLLCAEVAFLRRFMAAAESPTVIYAGASPGLHIPRLASMFPHVALFVLVDPLESAVEEGERFQILRCLMTDALAEELRERYGPDILFMSDVRVGPSSEEENETAQQERIHADMERQMRWHRLLDPIASVLKFRLPWNLGETTEYLDGVIQLPVFGKRLTHESRLVVCRGAGLVRYDNRRYERQMAYFNRVVRNAVLFDGRCFDCTALAVLCGGAAAKEIDRELICAGRRWFVRNRAAVGREGR